jgi:hypothetical protein
MAHVGFLLAVSFAPGLLFAIDILTLEQLTRYREQAMELSSLRTGGAQTLPLAHVCTGPSSSHPRAASER